MAKALKQETADLINNNITTSEYKDGYSISINGELDRALYTSLDEVLTSVGGKWNRSKKLHLFAFDPTPLLEKIVTDGVLPDVNPTAFFPTPLTGIEAMWSLMGDDSFFKYQASSESQKGFVTVLEPSAGIGAIADFIKSQGDNVFVDTVEILPENQAILKSKGYEPFCGSFLDFDMNEGCYDYIFINPPFSVKGDRHAYITHIQHAMKFLAPMGTLVAITPSGWTSNSTKKEEGFRNLVATHSSSWEIDTLPKGTFKESGTMVETKVVCLSGKENTSAMEQRHSNFRMAIMHEEKNYKSILSISREKDREKRLSAYSEFIRDEVFRVSALNGIFFSTDDVEQYTLWVETYSDDLIFNEGAEAEHPRYDEVCSTLVDLMKKISVENESILKKEKHRARVYLLTRIVRKRSTSVDIFNNSTPALVNELSVSEQLAIVEGGGGLLELMTA